MKKPAVFIDAFLSDDKRHDVFNYNVNNFVSNGWDVFILSNKIRDFSLFSKVKYFEYDSTNRILPDRSKYQLLSSIWYTFYLADGQNTYKLHGHDPIHGFTNWTLLYNLRHMAEVIKNHGYTHFITCEYDLTFKDYDLMNTIFKNFGKTENSTKCMIQRGSFGYGCMTSVYLINVDVVLNTIPVLTTEQDYINFLVATFGTNQAPVYEHLFSELFIKYDVPLYLSNAAGDPTLGNPTIAELLDEELTESIIDRSTGMRSAADTRRQRVGYKNLLLTPINNNSSFLIYHGGFDQKEPIFVDYQTNGHQETFMINADCWRLLPCKDTVTIKTSEMITDGFTSGQVYDLRDTYDFTLDRV